jgi:hypothetical protein
MLRNFFFQLEKNLIEDLDPDPKFSIRADPVFQHFLFFYTRENIYKCFLSWSYRIY